MAQVPLWALIASSNQVGVPEDISDAIAHLAPWDTKFLSAVGMSSLLKPCTSCTHVYQEIQERPLRTTLNGAISAGGTTFVLTDKVAIAGDRIQVNEEVVLLGSTSDNLTFTSCTRSVGTGADANHVSGDVVLVLGKPRAQGAAAGSTSDLVIMPDQITNYTQIFTKDIQVSGTSNALDRYGRSGSEYDYIAARQLLALKKELEHCLLWGVATAPSGTSTAGAFNGVYERINGYASDLGGISATLDNMRTAVRATQDYGSSPNLILCSPYQAQVFDSFGQAHVSHVVDAADPAVMTYGVGVSRLFVSGTSIDILPMDTINASMMVLNREFIGLGPLQGRDFAHVYLGVDGDRIKGQVIGEYTAEMRCPRSGYVFTSVKYA